MTEEKSFFAHPSAVVDEGAHIGDGTKIWHFCHISGEEVDIGPACILGQNTYVGPRVKIGKGVRVQNNVSIYDQVVLEDYVFCGPSMVFTNVINPRAHVPRKDEFKPTLVRRGATLGANCTIVCGVEIGRFAFIGAGAVVTHDVPEFGLMIGVPAERIGWMCHCGLQLHGIDDVTCDGCKSQYTITDEFCRAKVLKKCFEEK
ncbi:MAG: acyltransferase [Bdellovibrionales bacterium]